MNIFNNHYGLENKQQQWLRKFEVQKNEGGT